MLAFKDKLDDSKPKCLVTFTGIDNPGDLNLVESLYIYACAKGVSTEYAALSMHEKTSHPRFADFMTRFELSKRLPAAVHLCGKHVFQNLLCSMSRRNELKQIADFERVQVNINATQKNFTEDQVFNVYNILVDAGHTLILQNHEGSKDTIEKWLSTRVHFHSSKIHILNDSSKGQGMTPPQWSVDFRSSINGFAGGISPANITTQLQAINEQVKPVRDYWIDMESGIRTDDRLDIDKMKIIIDAVAIYQNS